MRSSYVIGSMIELRGNFYPVERIRSVRDYDGYCLLYTLSNGALVSFDSNGNMYEAIPLNIKKESK